LISEKFTLINIKNGSSFIWEEPNAIINWLAEQMTNQAIRFQTFKETRTNIKVYKEVNYAC